MGVLAPTLAKQMSTAGLQAIASHSGHPGAGACTFFDPEGECLCDLRRCLLPRRRDSAQGGMGANGPPLQLLAVVTFTWAMTGWLSSIMPRANGRSTKATGVTPASTPCSPPFGLPWRSKDGAHVLQSHLFPTRYPGRTALWRCVMRQADTNLDAVLEILAWAADDIECAIHRAASDLQAV